MTTTDIDAGAPLDAGMAIPVEVPAGLSPRGATVDDPTGTRARVDLVAGVILHDNQLIGESSAHTARTPPGSAAIALDRTSDLFVVGDRVDLHDLVDGRRLGSNGVVIAVTDGDIAVAIDAYGPRRGEDSDVAGSSRSSSWLRGLKPLARINKTAIPSATRYATKGKGTGLHELECSPDRHPAGEPASPQERGQKSTAPMRRRGRTPHQR